MLWNQIKTAFRIQKRQKLTAAINILGLGIGLTFFTLLVAYVREDRTFDRFHENADQIYILTNEFRDYFIGGVHHFIAELLEAEFPEVESGSTVRYAMHSQTVRIGDRLIVKDFAFTEPGFFGLFSFFPEVGNPADFLSDPAKIVLTAASARELFNEIDPRGKILSVRIGETFLDFTVSGIIQDPPGNSSLRFDGLLHYSHVFDAYQIDKNNNDFVTLPMFTTTFLKLSDTAKAASLRSKLPGLNLRLYGPMWERVKMKPPEQGFDLLRLTDYHLGDVRVASFTSRGNSTFTWVLSGIALLILILACVNSVNLAMAQCNYRLKEIGMRKVVGARKDQLIRQLLSESFLSSILSLMLGVSAAALMVTPFNVLTGRDLTEKSLLHPHTLILILASVLAVSIVVGLIPALTLSRSSTADIFRGRILSHGKSRWSLILIIFQFTASIFFIIGTIVITRQLHYMTSTDLGYDPSHIILVHTQVPGERASEGETLLKIFRSELQTDSRVQAVSADCGTVGSRHGSVTRRYEKDGVEHSVEAFLIDSHYMKTLNVPLVNGRDFSPERSLDSREGIIVNESFVREFELTAPVGMRFSDFAVDKLPPQYTFDPIIIGVVRDFFVFSLHERIGPLAFGPKGFPPIQRFRNILIKVRPGEEASVLKRLEAIWIGIRPDLPFSYIFLDDALAWEYRRERNWGRIVGWSAGFAVFIAGMGLFGLTAVRVIRRTKETGIRKVLGASAADIFFLFSKEALMWMMVSNLIAGPIALIAARKWLQQFAYRIDIGIWMFGLAALLSLFISGITVSWHAVRAALADPVKNLRYE